MTVKDTDLDGAALDIERYPSGIDAARARTSSIRSSSWRTARRAGAAGASMVAGDELGMSFLELE